MQAENASAPWRLVVTPPFDGGRNMACDEALGNAVLAGQTPPTFRLFRWSPPAISFGYSQQIGREVDVPAVRSKGVGIVRRMTGGRAVLHADELTYSVICAESDPVAGGGITATYTRISEGLAAGIQAVGVEAKLARTSDAAAPLRDRQASLPCFGSTTRAEVVVGGRKLIGSAQHRMRGLMIQHGSILLGPEHRELVEFLTADPELRDRYARRLESSTTSLRECGWRGSDDDLTDALTRGVSDALGVEFHAASLTIDEQSEISRLSAEKYTADWWNFPPAGTKAVKQPEGSRNG